MDISPSPLSALTLSTVLRSLCGAVSGWQLSRVLRYAVAMLVVRRVQEACARMERLAALFAAGRLPAARVVTPRVVEAPVEVPVVREKRVMAERVVPVRFGWLLQHMTWHAAVYSGQLREVLSRPEMVELLKACPQAVRIMRPICRMLAVETAVLRLGVVPKVRAVRPRAPRKKRPSEIIVYRPRGPGPGLGNPSTMIFNKRTGGLRFVPTKW